MYDRTYNAHRYSALKQINKKNVSQLHPVWTFQTGVLDGFECTPLVIDGIMYVTTPWNHAYAIDCKTGSQLWHYQKSLPENLALCCDAVNRGFAVSGDRLYMTTLDAHLVCLDQNTGEEIWDEAITVPRRERQGRQGHLQDGLQRHGGAAGHQGQGDHRHQRRRVRHSRLHRCLRRRDRQAAVAVLHGPRGRRQGRACPEGPEESGKGKSWLTGGGSAWVTGTYDPDLNTLYWGIGNPSPDFNGEVRKGDNLYTCSIVALNPDDGTYKWHFQNSPHDVWDYDGVNTPVLVDIKQGRQDGQGAGPGASQRLLLLPESRERRVHLRQAVLRGDLDRSQEGRRRTRSEDGPAVRQPRGAADRRRACASVPAPPAARNGTRWPITPAPATRTCR